MNRPRILDLFCGAGGAGVGYYRAGFDVIGVDLERHVDYPFGMFVSDAIAFIDQGWVEAGNFDAVHASPPCPRYSAATPAANRDKHPDLVGPIRDRLLAWGGPYVIENVPGAPLDNPLVLCGSMFDLGVRRHRLFEVNFPILALECDHRAQGKTYGVYGDHGDLNGAVPRPDGTLRGIKARDAAHAREVMGIDWMVSGPRNGWSDIADAIPPAYSEYIGRQLIEHIGAEAVA